MNLLLPFIDSTINTFVINNRKPIRSWNQLSVAALMDRGCVIRTVGCGYALESDLLWWNKGSLCDKKTLLLNSWASCCSSRSYACASAFTGQCGMRSARPRQGVAVVGACKEKGGSSPLPLDPSLVFLSMLNLSLSAFSDCRPGIPSVSDVQSLQLRAINRTLNEFCMLHMCMRVCKCGSSSAACRQEETWLDRRGSLSFKLSFAEHFIFKNIGGKFHSHVTHCWVSAIRILFCFGLELHYSLSLEFTISNISQNHLSINPNLTLTSRIENFIKLVFIFLFYINKICLILFCYWLKWGCSSKYWKLSITECCHQMSAPTCDLVYIIDSILFGKELCGCLCFWNTEKCGLIWNNEKKGLNSKHSGKSSKENMLFWFSVNCVSSCIMTDLH